MAAKLIIVAMMCVAMLGLQACFLPSGGYSNQSGYRYSQPGYEYNQPQYSQQQYGEYGQFPAYRYSQVPPPDQQYGDPVPGHYFQPDRRYAEQHTVCDYKGNNCLICDEDNDRCRHQSANW